MPAAIPAAIGLGGSLIQSLIGSGGAKSAAKTLSTTGNAVAGQIDKSTAAAVDAGYAGITQANDALHTNTNQANGTLRDVYNNLNGTIDPYLAAGRQGVTSLTAALAPGGALTKQFSFNPSDLENDPGYQFQLAEGMKAIQNSAAARGGLGAGGTMKSLANFNQGLAGTSFQNAYNRSANTFSLNRQNTLTGLGMLTNIGQNATNQAIGVGENFGNQTSNNDTTLGRSLSDVAMRGNEYVGDVGLRGAIESGKARMGASEATAAGQAASAKAWGTAVGGGTAALTSIFNPQSNYGPITQDMPAGTPAGVSGGIPLNPYSIPQAPGPVPYVPPAPWGTTR